MDSIIAKIWQGRFPSKSVNIGDVGLGGKHPIRLQSMTNTSTLKIDDTVEQSLRIIEAGADFVRISVPNKKSAENLGEIKKHIRVTGHNTPLIADIHYNPGVALIAARIAEKIRINPGNYGSAPSFERQITGKDDYNRELEQIHENISQLLVVCREYGTVIRIGTNHGSLSPRILYRYGNTAEGMVQATLEYIKIFEDHGFYNTVISLKSSDPLIMIDACRKMADALMKRKVKYPMHLGVTEAGSSDEGRIRSAVGICSLLNDGIGDTIRISLSEPPEKEMHFAGKIVKGFEKSYMISENEKSYFPETEKFMITTKLQKKLPNVPFEYPVVISARNNTNRRYEKENEYKTQGFLPPDFIYCEKQVEKTTQKIILPYSLWKKQSNDGIYPLINIQDLKEAKNIKSELKFFHVKTTDISKKDIKSVSSVKGNIIILETSFGTSVRNIIAFLNRVVTHGPVPVILKYSSDLDDRQELLVELSKKPGYLVAEGIINGLWLDSDDANKYHENTMLAYSLFQAAGKRITTNRYISCPTCARTPFDLQQIAEEVKRNTQHFRGLKIAVMGCAVNGPGEMADADYGLVGAGKGEIHLYKKQQIMKKNIEPQRAVSELVNLIEKSEALKKN